MDKNKEKKDLIRSVWDCLIEQKILDGHKDGNYLFRIELNSGLKMNCEAQIASSSCHKVLRGIDVIFNDNESILLNSITEHNKLKDLVKELKLGLQDIKTVKVEDIDDLTFSYNPPKKKFK